MISRYWLVGLNYIFWAVQSYCDARFGCPQGYFWNKTNVKLFKDSEIFRVYAGDQEIIGLTWKLIFLLIIYVSMGKWFALNHFWIIYFFEQPYRVYTANWHLGFRHRNTAIIWLAFPWLNPQPLGFNPIPCWSAKVRLFCMRDWLFCRWKVIFFLRSLRWLHSRV